MHKGLLFNAELQELVKKSRSFSSLLRMLFNLQKFTFGQNLARGLKSCSFQKKYISLVSKGEAYKYLWFVIEFSVMEMFYYPQLVNLTFFVSFLFIRPLRAVGIPMLLYLQETGK